MVSRRRGITKLQANTATHTPRTKSMDEDTVKFSFDENDEIVMELSNG
jgi:hypothetical protein